MEGGADELRWSEDGKSSVALSLPLLLVVDEAIERDCKCGCDDEVDGV
jgi:hypothetical protein